MLKEVFLEKAIIKHGNKYCYDLVPNEFKATDKITVVCPEHGEFYPIARNHTNSGTGCPICGRLKASKKTSIMFKDFITKAQEIHGDKYDYKETDYKNISTKMSIFCKQCKKYYSQLPSNHLQGNGCPYCNPMPKKLTYEEFTSKLSIINPNIEIIGEYCGNKKYITVKCKIDGHIWDSKPNWLLKGQGCQECYDRQRGVSLRKEISVVLEEANKIHNNFYTYPFIESEYKNSKSLITIICPIHGKFYQTMNKHINCKQGCRICNQSHLEREVMMFLQEHSINFEEQKTFDWLVYKDKMKLDFYLPDYNIAIECQGEQHFNPVNFGSKNINVIERFNLNIDRDLAKHNLCINKGIKIFYIIKNNFNLNEFSEIKNNKLYNAENTFVIQDLKKHLYDLWISLNRHKNGCENGIL